MAKEYSDADLTYHGRCIDEQREMGMGYCGSVSRKGHDAQLAAPGINHAKLWSSKWLEVGQTEVRRGNLPK